VERVKTHPIYKKRFVVRKKFYVHDEENQWQIWDVVRFRESSPISKLKRWTLIEIVKRQEA
jgi:small subunit ribosomal protein S17